MKNRMHISLLIFLSYTAYGAQEQHINEEAESAMRERFKSILPIVHHFITQLNESAKAGTVDTFSKNLDLLSQLTIGQKIDIKDFCLNEDKKTTLHIAAENGHSAIVNLCVQHFNNINNQTKDGLTALHIAAQNGSLAIVQTLCRAGADINVTTHDKHTALVIAVMNGHGNVVAALCRAGADFKTPGRDDTTLLHCAADNGYESVVLELCKAGADVNAQRTDGSTAFHFAYHNGHENIVRILCQSGADISLKFNPKMNIEFAQLSPQSTARMTKIIVDTHQNLRLLQAIKTNNVQDVKELLKKASDNAINMPTLDGHSLLMWATDNILIVDQLIRAKAHVNYKDPNGWTPLHYAVCKNLPSVISSLIGAQAIINAQDKQGNSPLHFACILGPQHIHIMQILLVHGAHIEAKNMQGDNVISIAQKMKNMEAIKLLENKKARMSIPICL